MTAEALADSGIKGVCRSNKSDWNVDELCYCFFAAICLYALLFSINEIKG